MVRRRYVILGLGAAAAAWPQASRAQPSERVRRIGILMNRREDDPEAAAQIRAFVRGLDERGWKLGRNVEIEYRWGAGEASRYRKYAEELAAHSPDVLVAAGGTAVGALQQATRTTPIVFVTTTDPVGRGLVASMARPGGNTTGFIQFDFSISAKWMELLSQIAPGVTRVAVIRDPAEFSGVGELAVIQAAAASRGVEVSPVDVRDERGLEGAIAAFASGPDRGLIVTGSGSAYRSREMIIGLAARYRLPAVYADRFDAMGGGLVSYGPDRVEQFRVATDYVDRILKGEMPSELPVQAPTKYEMVINLRTANALGLTISPSLLATADEVIE